MKNGFLMFLMLFQFSFSKELLLSGAASLKEYLEKNITEYKKIEPDSNITLNLGGSGTLKKQLERGGDIDIIFLADRGYMTDLKKNNYIEDVEVILENSLALIKNKNVTSESGVLAIGDPKYMFLLEHMPQKFLINSNLKTTLLYMLKMSEVFYLMLNLVKLILV